MDLKRWGRTLLETKWMNRRPLVWIVLLFMTGGILAKTVQPLLFFSVCIVMLFLIGMLTWKRKSKFPFLPYLLFLWVGYLFTYPALFPCYIFVPHQATWIKGQVATSPLLQESRGIYGFLMTQVVLQEPDQDSLDLVVSVQLSSEIYEKMEELRPGDMITLYGSLQVPEEERRIQYLGEGIGYFFRVADVGAIQQGEGSWWYLPQQAATLLTQWIDILYPKTKGVIKGIVLGINEALPEETLTAFRGIGIGHILAVSGLHVGFLTALLMGFAKLLHLKRWGILLFVGTPLFLYCLVVGFTPSVVRATIMAVLLLLGKTLGKAYDIYTGMAMAALITLLFHPAQLFSLGFQLSFLAVWGIASFFPLFSKLFKKLPTAIGDAAAVSLSAQCGVLPLSIATFQNAHVLSVFVNVLLIPVAGLGTMLAFISLFFFPIVPMVAQGVAYLGEGLVLLLDRLSVLLFHYLPGYMTFPFLSGILPLFLYGMMLIESPILLIEQQLRIKGIIFLGVLFLLFLLPAIVG